MTRIQGKKAILQNVISAVAVCNDKAPITLAPDGLHFNTLSGDRSSMVVGFYPKELFEVWEVENRISFSLSIEEVKGKIKRCADVVEIEVKDAQCHINSGQLDYAVRTYGVEEQKDLPKPPYTVTITADKDDFVRALEDILEVGSATDFSKSEGANLSLSAIVDGNEVKRVFSGGDQVGSGSGAYNAKTIVSYCKAVDAESITVQYGDRMPIKLILGNVTYMMGGIVPNES